MWLRFKLRTVTKRTYFQIVNTVTNIFFCEPRTFRFKALLLSLSGFLANVFLGVQRKLVCLTCSLFRNKNVHAKHDQRPKTFEKTRCSNSMFQFLSTSTGNFKWSFLKMMIFSFLRIDLFWIEIKQCLISNSNISIGLDFSLFGSLSELVSHF